jgi:aldose 1-epimerase
MTFSAPVPPIMSSLSSENNFAFLPQGAIIQEFTVQGHNIVQAFPRAELYNDGPYFGETIGRTSNRIKDATINSLNGKSYKLAQNNGPNSLHGGNVGFGKRVFQGPVAVERNGREAVRFTYLSPDGEEEYPGTIELRVWYTAWEEKEDGVTKVCLEAEYEVEMVGDECEETVVGITNHR